MSHGVSPKTISSCITKNSTPVDEVDLKEFTEATTLRRASKSDIEDLLGVKVEAGQGNLDAKKSGRGSFDDAGMMFDMELTTDESGGKSAGDTAPVANSNSNGQPKGPEEHIDSTQTDTGTVTQLGTNTENPKIPQLQSDGNSNRSFERIGPKNFELLTLLGRGAFGKVVLAKHLGTGNVFALKITTKEFLHSKTAIDCTIEERDALARIEHPFLVKLLAAFQTKSKVYLVMEYIIGGELFSHLNNRAFFLEPEARFYAAEVVLALEYLHKVGIIHRDLKPENVLLDDKGHIRITDFGFAKSMDSAQAGEDGSDTPCKTICGTDEYMAPEMVS